MYRNKHNEVVGLRDLSEVSLCKAHSSTLYRAKKRHERNKEEDIHHTSADSNNEFASTEVTATIVQPQTPVSPADSCPQHTNMEEDSSVSAVKATLPRMGNHLPHQPLSTSSEYSLMRMIPSTFQSSDTNTIMGDMNTSLSHKRKRAAYQHHRTQSPNKINTSFIVQAQHHNQPKLSPHQSTSIYNGDRHPSNALTRNHLFIKKPQPHHNNTSTPNSTMNATDNNITPPVHTIPSQQYLLDRFSSSQLPPLQTSHHFSDKNNNKITATTSAKSSEQIHQPVPIQPHYSLVQPYPTANATSCVSSMSHTLPSPSMIPPSSISIMQHPQLSSSPYSFSGTAANNSKHSQVHSQQHESEDVIATSPKSHDSTSSVNNVSMGPTINRPNSSHSKSSKHEEDNDRLIIETVSLRPSLPPHPNPTSPYTAAVGSAATAATTDDNNYNARYYFRNLAITDNFTFRDLLAEVDIQGSPPPPGKRIVISDLSSERIYPLDRPIRDVITKPTSTHIELCLGLVDKPSIDWSAYS
ncbi:hypothetical protein BDF20DRAFT_284846 [Mycotypha africana]|uniref:uncharacterized protein n=1 Tax=Mycotypha africana TaxID=64632 RepID=UPI002301277B|nr:uncharacterized protein BDF20DRAFT_284846 [Mycotypha africana]KAI8987707.1 hypothetical protein BDF20DRAFT_284846 [Mycotypha africana]